MTKQERMARIRELSDALWFAEGEEYDKLYAEYCELNAEEDKAYREEKEDLYFQNQNLQTYIDNHEPIWKRNTKQAVKDTAKEIYAQVLEWSPVGEDYHCFITNLENWLKEKYGLEVE